MPASYPASVKSFTALNPGETVLDTHPEAAYDEITAMQNALLSTGLAHALFPDSTNNARGLGKTTARWGQAYVKGITLGAATELTIATGAITATPGVFTVDTESDAATDDLDTITAGSGCVEGSLVALKAENVSRVVTIKHGTGNILLMNGDFALSTTGRMLLLYYTGSSFVQLSGGGVGSMPPVVILPTDNHPPIADYATPSVRSGNYILEFDGSAATGESAIFKRVLPASYGGGNLAVDVYWTAASGITGNVKWNASFEQHAAGADIDVDSFASAQTTTTACAGTNGLTALTTITFTSAQIDSLAAGNPFRLKLQRDSGHASDTMDAVDAQVELVVVREV